MSSLPRLDDHQIRLFFERLMELLPDYVYFKDRDGRIVCNNAAHAHHFGLSSPQEAQGRTDYDFYPRRLAEVKDADEREIIRTGKGIRDKEERATREEGHPRWLLTTKLPLVDVDGAIIGTFGLSREITEVKEARESLRQKQELIATLVEMLPSRIYMLDRDGRLTFTNEAFRATLGGRSTREIEGRRLDEFGADVPNTHGTSELEEILRTGEAIINREEPDASAPGQDRWVLVSRVPLKDRHGTVHGLVGIITDITEQKRAEERAVETSQWLELGIRQRTAELHEANQSLQAQIEATEQKAAELRGSEERIRQLNEQLEARVRARTAELEAANRELESFSYSVSHDLRSPLRGIDGWSQALLEDYGPGLDDQARTYIHRVRCEAQRLSSLIDDLLDLARTTRAELRPASVDLSDLASHTAQRVAASRPEIDVTFECDADLHARGDPVLLEAALFNLLDNAWKFSAGKPTATVRFGRATTPRGPAFFVRDEGAGFDMRHARNLFGAFQRMHTQQEFPGTGIGLATVQRIIHRHGGEIWAESAPHAGATFYFTLGAEPLPRAADP